MLASRCAVVALLAVAACAQTTNPARQSDEINTATNTDVQVLSAKSGGLIFWTLGKGTLDVSRCTFGDRQATTSTEFPTRASADCTEMLVNGLGPSINHYVEPLASLREGPDGLEHFSFRHWCGQVEIDVAVKAAAWDAPSFDGIGFYAPSAPARVGTDRMFYAKNDPLLNRIGEATLASEGHEKVYIYRFVGAGPCEVNGTGDNPSGSLEFKPYVSFAGEHERWEAVPQNHGIAYEESWDRRRELLE
jgi:hypothetical protein